MNYPDLNKNTNALLELDNQALLRSSIAGMMSLSRDLVLVLSYVNSRVPQESIVDFYDENWQ